MKKKNIAIVTGASSGLGKEFVKLLSAKKGLDEIWIISRNEEKLKKIQKRYGEKIVVYPMDLSSLENIKTFGENPSLKNCNIRYLINNAGFAKFCSYPHMKKGSHILNIASQASFQPLPYQNIYSSTKAFVRNYTRALNVELREKGITATAVCPGWMKTGLYDRGIIDAKKATTNFTNMVTPDVVAKKALADAEHGKDMSVYSTYVKTCHTIAKLLPQKTMMKLWLIQQRLL